MQLLLPCTYKQRCNLVEDVDNLTSSLAAHLDGCLFCRHYDSLQLRCSGDLAVMLLGRSYVIDVCCLVILHSWQSRPMSHEVRRDFGTCIDLAYAPPQSRHRDPLVILMT